jgi:hypothetical protein
VSAFESGFSFEVLNAQDRAAFSCGVEALDRYLKEQASQDLRKRAAAVFVMTVTGTNRIAGFYTLSACSIDANDLSSGLVKQLKFPRYPNLPATLVGRLARDLSFRGQRIGELLLVNALERALFASEQVASITVVVDAKDEKAIRILPAFRVDHIS